MSEKDVTEKMLAEYNDVFADIMNVFLFGGQQVVSPNDLEDTNTRSMYKADRKVHEMERDVSKHLKKDQLTVLMAGFEHQTKAEKYMPVRIIGYDGQKEEGATMCAVLDRVENKGRSEGRAEGELMGKVSVYYNDMKLSPEQIAEKVNKPLDEILKIIENLE